MIRLYLMRHGAAVDLGTHGAAPDAERPLTRKGMEKTREAALGLKALGVEPTALVSSPYRRALQTAEIVAQVLGFPAARIRRTDALKPAARPTELIHELAQIRAREVLCFGHAPNMDMIIAHVLGTRSAVTALKKAGVACLELPAATGVLAGRGALVWMLPPKVLRSLA
jgi:phosphohistidine phosphatase